MDDPKYREDDDASDRAGVLAADGAEREFDEAVFE